MCFIYHFEQTQPYFPRIEKILFQAQSGKTEIITSIVSVIETLSPAKYLTQPEVTREVNLLFRESDYIKVYGVDWEIAQHAAELRRQFTYLRTPDAIQLATAVVSQADMFITNDERLKKLASPPIKILSLNTIRLDGNERAIKN